MQRRILMYFRTLFIILYLLSSVSTFAQVSKSYTEIYDEFQKLEIDESQTFFVNDVFLQRDRGMFIFSKGSFHFFKPVNGAVRMAAFFGEGSFSFTPPTQVEMDQMERWYETPDFNKEFKEIFFVFTDDLFEEISSQSKAVTQSLEKTKYDAFAYDIRSYLLNEKYKELSTQILKPLCESKDLADFFLAFVKPNAGDIFAWSIDPWKDEEVRFYHGVFQTGGLNSYIEPISIFHKQEYYEQNVDLDKIDNDELKINKIESEIKINFDYEFFAEIKLNYTPVKDNFQWINFVIHRNVTIESVTDEQGNNLDFYKYPNEQFQFCVKLNEPAKKDETRQLNFKYKAEFLKRDQNRFQGTKLTTWYPNYGYREKINWDLKAEYPNNIDFIACGNKISEEKSGEEYRRSHWTTDIPIEDMIFDIGPFKVSEAKFNDLPVTIHTAEFDNAEYVIEDSKNSFMLFTELFGPIDYDKLDLVLATPQFDVQAAVQQMNLNGGTPGQITFTLDYATLAQSHPGYKTLFFGNIARVGGVEKGSFERNISQFVSGIWWEENITSRSYRDALFFHGISDYSSLIYVNKVMEDKEQFLDFLDMYKEIIYDAEKNFGNGIALGSISIGYRNNTSRTGHSFVLIKKAAWVLHMLRTLMLNPNTMDESSFTNFMKTFFQKYKRKSASINDFQRELTQFLGFDMKWFFDQWVHGTELPIYQYMYKTEETSDGKYIIKMKIKTEGVDDKFIMYVPLKIDFGSDQFARLRVPVQGKHSVWQSPPLPMEPDEVIFNDLKGVLCKVDEEDWED